MKHTFAVALMAGLVLGSGGARAGEAATAGVSLEGGSTGLGAHLSIPIESDIGARLGFGYFKFNYSGNTSDTDYDFKMKLQSFDALLDWFPMEGSFRLSAGLAANGNNIGASAKSNANGSYTFDGHSYQAASAGRITGSIDFQKMVPYLGFGWGSSSNGKGWGLSSDFGLLFQGKPRTSLSSSGCSAPALVCAQLNADLVTESDKLADEVKGFKYYPVVRAGLSYTF
ncbi:MAG: hypothetical protein V4582_25360 [Pseudomonadota bacterium]